MKWTAQDIKDVLSAELQKTGSSLEDFETQLRQRPTSLDKTAADPVSIAKGLLNSYGLLTVGGGAALGAGLYGAYKMNQDSSDRVMKKMKEQQQYEEATRSLRAAMQGAQTEGLA